MKSSESTPEVRDNALEFVIFVVGGDFFALPADSVIEVVDPPPVSPIPFMPAYVDGVVNVGGRVVPQIDLKQCLFDNVPGSNESGQVLLVDTAGPPCALAVERVVVLAEMAAEQVSRLTGATSSSRERKKVRGMMPSLQAMMRQAVRIPASAAGSSPVNSTGTRGPLSASTRQPLLICSIWCPSMMNRMGCLAGSRLRLKAERPRPPSSL
jgi:chemotaxis signal transduction protein